MILVGIALFFGFVWYKLKRIEKAIKEPIIIKKDPEYTEEYWLKKDLPKEVTDIFNNY